MFKSAATKIAHNTTIPALAGNSDLRPLQDLITAEKAVLMTCVESCALQLAYVDVDFVSLRIQTAKAKNRPRQGGRCPSDLGPRGGR